VVTLALDVRAPGSAPAAAELTIAAGERRAVTFAPAQQLWIEGPLGWRGIAVREPGDALGQVIEVAATCDTLTFIPDPLAPPADPPGAGGHPGGH
jgi:hypothetical protein